MERTKEEYLELIKKEFPEVSFQNSRLITHGWDNNVIVLDDRLIFRFPKSENYIRRFQVEVKFLEHLLTKVTLPIPKYIYLSKDRSFGGYQMLTGTEMQPELFNSQSEIQKTDIAKALGKFISDLHSTPTEILRNCGFKADPKGHWWGKRNIESILKELREKVFPELTNKEVDWVEHQFNEYLGLSFDFEPKIIHYDLNNKHILFDQTTGALTGIIDFSDIDIADPAADFAGLWDYGNLFAEQTFSFYSGQKDKDLLRRSKFPGLIRPIKHMLETKQGRKIPDGYEILRKKLSEMIASGFTM
ncbi:MAG: aminoglycoside phosphotransferase family protein [Candidatus Pacebacteria bacterium]|nr:aminoglycoside phosphotransferase family protein [Candidatus Paceibacterota bacterium]MDD5356924.1 aminoglycoside phosphotransferase family protein [Candidatus Paceibacterota bacterium]